MLLVGICDGDTAVRVTLSDFIKRYKDETGINVQVLAYDNGEKLLRHYPFEMDLIFLEISFAKMSGIEIARRIRQVDAHVGIVFLTTLLNHVLEAYEVRANNYLIKPLRYARFLKEAEQARNRRGETGFLSSQAITAYIRFMRKPSAISKRRGITPESIRRTIPY